MMNLKRIRSWHDLLDDNYNNNDHHHLDQSIAISQCLVFLSQEKESSPSSPPIIDHPHHIMTNKKPRSSCNRVFECKTCNRRFASFQALGGHRASHKKPRPSTTGAGEDADQPLPSKPKSTHGCSVCGLEFSIGQALGGHMRRHRDNNKDHGNHRLEKGGGAADGGGSLWSPPLTEEEEIRATSRPVVKRSVSGKRVLLSLDLNLTPFENGLEFLKLGRSAPMVDCFF